MRIYVVRSGDTLYGIARRYQTEVSFLSVWNDIEEEAPLAVGQSLLILQPTEVYTVEAGDSFSSIAARYGLSLKTFFARNPGYEGGARPLSVGDTVVLFFEEEGTYPLTVNGYAYPFIAENVLTYGLPYLTYLSPFTYGFTEEGDLLPLQDEALLDAAFSYGTAALLHLSTLTAAGTFSSELADTVLGSEEASERLIEEVYRTVTEKGFSGVDIDFEFIKGTSAAPYADFVRRMREKLSPAGLTVIVALAPKTSANQPGLLYEGHDYKALGEAADAVFLMTYEWGYTYGPPMAVAPIEAVRRVLDYAVSEIPPEKILMGIPNYAYNWALPYQPGETKAESFSNAEAVALAVRVGAEIRFSEEAQTPFFNYNEEGVLHEVWFEDARSVSAKLALAAEYGFLGVGYWNMMRKFTQNWMILETSYRIVNG